MLCPLCGSASPAHSVIPYFHCGTCDLHFLDPAHRLSADEEIARYRTHENDIHDPAYREFVRPLFQAVRERISPAAHGLDFGAGSGPVLAHMFGAEGYPTAVYDPYFWPDRAPLAQNYDFVVSCEVVEHLYSPREEFPRLYNLLKPGGWLGIKTHLVEAKTDFASWYYRRDPTHVVFYSRKTFAWIAQHHGFSNLTYVGERIVLLQRPLGSEA